MASDKPDTGAGELDYRDVAPIGKRKTWGHLNMGDKPHVWGEFELNEYPPSPEGEALSDFRRALGMYLGQAGDVLGLRPSQISNLERGAATCNWEYAKARLFEAASKRTRNA